jgi:hypothetical protein
MLSAAIVFGRTGRSPECRIHLRDRPADPARDSAVRQDQIFKIRDMTNLPADDRIFGTPLEFKQGRQLHITHSDNTGYKRRRRGQRNSFEPRAVKQTCCNLTSGMPSKKGISRSCTRIDEGWFSRLTRTWQQERKRSQAALLHGRRLAQQA